MLCWSNDHAVWQTISCLEQALLAVTAPPAVSQGWSSGKRGNRDHFGKPQRWITAPRLLPPKKKSISKKVRTGRNKAAAPLHPPTRKNGVSGRTGSRPRRSTLRRGSNPSRGAVRVHRGVRGWGGVLVFSCGGPLFLYLILRRSVRSFEPSSSTRVRSVRDTGVSESAEPSRTDLVPMLLCEEERIVMKRMDHQANQLDMIFFVRRAWHRKTVRGPAFLAGMEPVHPL